MCNCIYWYTFLLDHRQAYVFTANLLHEMKIGIVLAMIPNHLVSSSLGFDPDLNHFNGSYHSKRQTIAIGPVLPTNTRHLNSTILPSLKHLSSGHIVTWSVGRLCSLSPCFTSHSHICDRTNIGWVAIGNRRHSPDMWHCFTAIHLILVQ